MLEFLRFFLVHRYAGSGTDSQTRRSSSIALKHCALVFGTIVSLVTDILPVMSAHKVMAQTANRCGLMVMAHGGEDDWNEAVKTAVDPLTDKMPVRIAFGMADPSSMSKAVTELEAVGVECIAVVRLFLSGKSFLHQTEYLFGLRQDAPEFFVSHAAHGPSHEPSPIAVKSEILLSEDGLLDAPAVGGMLKQRAIALHSVDVEQSLLLLAHGAGNDEVNAEWLRKMDLLADSVRATGSFNTVKVATLREDWPEKRQIAEKAIRGFVEEQFKMGIQTVVVPVRLYGMGPYEKVLEGLSDVTISTGILPDPAVTAWIESQANKLSARSKKAPNKKAGVGVSGG